MKIELCTKLSRFERIKMEEWQIRQKHYEDLRMVQRELGFLDNKGRVRKFNGKTFWPVFEKLGHTKGELERCDCWTKRFACEH